MTGWNKLNNWYPNRAERLPLIDGVTVTDILLIAKSFRRSGLWITCSNEDNIRLGLNTHLPIELEFASLGHVERLRMYLSVLQDDVRTYSKIKNSPEFIFDEAIWRRNDKSDLLFTPPLAADGIRNLVNAFKPAVPELVRVDAAETGTEMYGVVDGWAIADFATKCTGHTVRKL